MAEEVGRKVAGRVTVVRPGDFGKPSGKGRGKIEFSPPAAATNDRVAAAIVVAEERLAKAHRDQARRTKATAEQVAAVERAGGKVEAPDGAEPAGE